MTCHRVHSNATGFFGCPKRRRGVSSVLAMMFLVIFGSLTAAMAVVAQSNVRTADSGLKLSRAMSAAETGMVFATRRLAEESARFVVTKGVIGKDVGERFWMGTYSSADGTVQVIQPDGYNTGPGVIHALRDAHDRDNHNIVVSGAPSTSTIDAPQERLRVPAARLSTATNSAYFILTYTFAFLADVPYIRVTSVGVDGDIRRTLQMDFKIDKKIEFAILSPNRVMIGKNVRIEGPLGSRYGIGPDELNGGNGDPLVMRSEFYYLDPDLSSDGLNAKLDVFFDRVRQFDVDGDARLRPDHPGESAGVSGLSDYDGDQYIDDFDLFLQHFDDDADKRVVYDAAMADAAGLGTLTVEYGGNASDDLQMLRLIDDAIPDRDGDGTPGTANDIAFGWNDGVINAKDMYAKVHGRLAFAVDRSSWDNVNGASYQTIVRGPIRAGIDVAPVTFEVSDEEMREITTDMFAESAVWFNTTATGTLGGPDVVPPAQERESVPFGAIEAEDFGTRGAYDYYHRPKYVNRTFTNVRIPKGTNALFEDCTFVGVTWVETNADCDHHDWNYVGAVKKIVDPDDPDSFNFPERFPGLTADTITDTRAESNNIRFHNCTFLGSLAGTRPLGYTHWRNKVQFTGNTRFYIDPTDSDLASQADAGTLISQLNSLGPTARAEMEKSSIFMPGWSLDAGSFTNESPKVKLKGTIIAGVFDIRGTADVLGTLLMTFRPATGEGPLFYGGLPDSFNTTIGYFHASDGDSEGGDPGDADFEGFGEITLRYNPDMKLPDGIPWPIRIDPDPTTYVE